MRTNDNYLDGYEHEMLYERTRDYYINKILPRIRRGGVASLNLQELRSRILPQCEAIHARNFNFASVSAYERIIERFTLANVQQLLDKPNLPNNQLFVHTHENLRSNSLIKVIVALIRNTFHDDITARDRKTTLELAMDAVQQTTVPIDTSYDIVAFPVYSLAGNDPLYGLYDGLERNYDAWSIAKVAYYNRVFLIVDRQFIIYFDVCDAKPIISVKNHQISNKAVAGSSNALSSLPFRQLYALIPTAINPATTAFIAPDVKNDPIGAGAYLIDFFSTLSNLPIFAETCVIMSNSVREPEDYIAAVNCWVNIHARIARSNQLAARQTRLQLMNSLQEVAVTPIIGELRFSGTVIHIQVFDDAKLDSYSRDIVKHGIFNITNHASFQVGRVIRAIGNNRRITRTPRPRKTNGLRLVNRLLDGPAVASMIILNSSSRTQIMQIDTLVETQLANFDELTQKITTDIMLPVARCLPFLYIARTISRTPELLTDGRTLVGGQRDKNLPFVHRLSMHSWYSEYTGILVFDSYRVWPNDTDERHIDNPLEEISTREGLLARGLVVVRNIDNLHKCLRKIGLRPYGGNTRQILVSHPKSRFAVAALRITTDLPSDVSLYVYFIISRLVEQKMSIVSPKSDIRRLREMLLINATSDDAAKSASHKMPLYVTDELINYASIVTSR